MTNHKTLQMEAEQAAKEALPYLTDDMPSRVRTLGNRESFVKGYLARAAKEGWQTIETAPKDGTAIDLWESFSNGDGVRWCDYAWISGFNSWVDTNRPFERQFVDASHWMPTPNPPHPPSHDKE